MVADAGGVTAGCGSRYWRVLRCAERVGCRLPRAREVCVLCAQYRCGLAWVFLHCSRLGALLGFLVLTLMVVNASSKLRVNSFL